MATKIPLKLESGSLQQLSSTDTIPVQNLATGTATSSVFLRGDGTWATPSGVAGGNWTNKISTYTAVSGDKIIANTTGGSFTITLPPTPVVGDSVDIIDGGDWSVNNLTVARNNSTVENNPNDVLISVKGVSVSFIYDGSTWQVISSLGQKGDTGEVSLNGVQTLTNKRVVPRVNNNGGVTSGTIVPTGDLSDQYELLGLTGSVTVDIPSGTPLAGQKLMLRIKDNGTSRGLTWTTSSGGYRVVGAVLPVSTTVSKNTYVGCVYNSLEGFWDVVAVATQL